MWIIRSYNLWRWGKTFERRISVTHPITGRKLAATQRARVGLRGMALPLIFLPPSLLAFLPVWRSENLGVDIAELASKIKDEMPDRAAR